MGKDVQHVSRACAATTPWRDVGRDLSTRVRIRDVVVNNVQVAGARRHQHLRGWDAAHPLGITLNNVVFDSAPTTITASDANIVLGPGGVTIAPAGTASP